MVDFEAMNRFRVWNNNFKKYLDLNYLALMPDGVLYETSFGELMRYTPDTEIEWCTGAKDKNGKLVYEGDIIKYKRCWSRPVVNSKGQLDYEFHDPGEWEVGYVLWLWASYRWGIAYRRYDDFDDFQGINHRTEVIGSIRENPELAPWYPV